MSIIFLSVKGRDKIGCQLASDSTGRVILSVDPRSLSLGGKQRDGIHRGSAPPDLEMEPGSPIAQPAHFRDAFSALHLFALSNEDLSIVPVST
jgi:hypothetical protein